MSPIEIIAAILGVASVYLTIRESMWCWPIGIAMVALYAWVFYDAKLYSDVILQVAFLVLQIYCWWRWQRGLRESASGVPISRLSPPIYAVTLAGGLAATIAIGFLMSRYTDAAAPFPDSGILVFSLIAQYLLSKKRVQSWHLWIAVDLAAVPLYAWRDLWLTSGLYILFLGLAIKGLLTWSVALRRTGSSLESSSRLTEDTSSSSTSHGTTPTT